MIRDDAAIARRYPLFAPKSHFPTLEKRRFPRVVAVSATALALTAPVFLHVAFASIPPPELLVSKHADRRTAVPLRGTWQLGKVYVFARAAQGYSRAEFWLDTDYRVAKPNRVETTSPYDLKGGTAATALPLDTAKLREGSHYLTLRLTATSGLAAVQTEKFRVVRTAVVAPGASTSPQPSPVSTPSPVPTTPPVSSAPVPEPTVVPEPAPTVVPVPEPTVLPAPEPTPVPAPSTISPVPVPALTTSSSAPAPAPSTPAPTQPAPPSNSSGYPNASNTGVPDGTSLSNLNGMVDVLDSGVSIGGVMHSFPASGIKAVGTNGAVLLAPAKVTITNARMTRLRNRSSGILVTGARVAIIADAGTTGAQYTVDATQSSGTARIALSDCTVFGSTVSVTIAWKNFSIDRCDVSGGMDAVRLGQHTSVTNSYLHDLLRLPGSHNDIFQIIGGSNVVIRHNTALAATWASGSLDPMNAVLQIGNLTNDIDNVVFDDNYVDGGNYTFNANWTNVDLGSASLTGVSITNNVFGRNFRYGPKTSMSHGIVWSGNRWADTGGPV